MEISDSFFRRIQEDDNLSKILAEKCCEHEVCAEIDERIEEGEYVILKVDDYYNSLNIEKRPKSPDCLILQRCSSINQYKMTIVELKDSKDTAYVTEAGEKIKTCIDDFISTRFKELLDRDYQDVKIYLVSRIELYRRKERMHSLKMEALMNKRYEFRSKTYMIQPFMPNPTIKPCY